MLAVFFQRVSSILDNTNTLRWMLILAALLFSFGLFIPMITISKFVVIENSLSIMSGLSELVNNGQIVIFLLVGIFSVVLPIVKIGFLFMLLQAERTASQQHQRLLYLMHDYGRWTMLDVMVVAILIVTVKLGVIASIEVHLGLYLFGSAVLLLMLITSKVSRLSEKIDCN